MQVGIDPFNFLILEALVILGFFSGFFGMAISKKLGLKEQYQQALPIVLVSALFLLLVGFVLDNSFTAGFVILLVHPVITAIFIGPLVLGLLVADKAKHYPLSEGD